MQAKIFEHEKMERHPIYIKLMRVITVPLLNIIPAKFLQGMIRNTSSYGTKVIDKPGTTHSLEIMYTKEKKTDKAADTFWHNIVSQPKAIRNRLKIVEMILEDEIDEQKKKTKEIQIYNIGGGSSRAIIQVVSKSIGSDFKIKVTTVDRDVKALELGEKIAQEHNVRDLFTWIEGDARNLEKLVELNKADVIEMVGLLDYFDFNDSVSLIKQIYNCLHEGGLFIVANVHPNSESQFVENVGWPKMYYKTTEEMARILNKAGFKEEYITLHLEPLKVHIIAVARKNK